MRSLLVASLVVAFAGLSIVLPAHAEGRFAATAGPRVNKWKLDCLGDVGPHLRDTETKLVPFPKPTEHAKPILPISAAKERYGAVRYEMTPSLGEGKPKFGDQLQGLADWIVKLSGQQEGHYLLAVEIVGPQGCLGSDVLLTASYKRKSVLFFVQEEQQAVSEKLSGELLRFFELSPETNRLSARVAVFYSKDRSFDPKAFHDLIQLGHEIQLIALLPIPAAAQSVITSLAGVVSVVTNAKVSQTGKSQVEMAFLKDDAPSKPPSEVRYNLPAEMPDGKTYMVSLKLVFETRGPKLPFDGTGNPAAIIQDLKISIGNERLPVLDYLRVNGDERVRTLFKSLDGAQGGAAENIGAGCSAVEDAFFRFNNELDATVAYFSFLHRYAQQIKKNPQKEDCYNDNHKAEYERRGWRLPAI